MGHANTADLQAIRKAAAAKAVATMRARRAEMQSSYEKITSGTSQVEPVTGDHSGRCNCENCGLPNWVYAAPGFHVQITRKAENRFKRDSKSTVWVCSMECGAQALAVAAYGKATSRWPMTLDKFRATVSSMFVRRVAQTAVN